MPSTEERQKDVLLLGFGIQLSLFAVLIPALFPLVFVSGFILLWVLIDETIRRLDEYSDS
ncbi:hypothetical protein [Haloplanus salilacus]|uniref:hypothetical protein n=1 Tax=Haloplanus salilacus TaxID=2949994 RepID=UPI0030CECC50